MSQIFDQHLEKNAANFVALSPVSFVERSAEVFADLPAVIHGQRRYSWAQVRERSARLAASLRAAGVKRGQHDCQPTDRQNIGKYDQITRKMNGRRHSTQRH